MVDELRKAIERAQRQPEAVQRQIAALIEQALEQAHVNGASPDKSCESYAGAWSDLQDDDEFAAFDRMRHEVAPTLPMEEQLAWLDDE
jgi:hypothetical protein